MKVLIFPATSEIANEVIRSLEYQKDVELVLASGVGIGHYLPFVSDEDFHHQLDKLVLEENIDWIFPTNELALYALKDHPLNCLHCAETIEICNEKVKTYEALYHVVRVPKIYNTFNKEDFPLFVKPNTGHSGMGCRKVEWGEYKWQKDHLLLEYLPGDEYTIDCLTDHNGKLRYSQARRRVSIGNGIALKTELVEWTWEIAEKINQTLKLRGAWFFQMKEKDGEMVLMEVGARIAGSSGINRLNGINLAYLSLLSSEGQDYEIIRSCPISEITRKLDVKATAPEFKYLYVDWDDTLCIGGKIDPIILAFVFKCKNEGKEVKIITRNEYPLIRQHGLEMDYVYVKPDLKKSDFMLSGGLLIDDSHRERMDAVSAGMLAIDPNSVYSFI